LQVVAELERRGVPCWIAPRNVRPGRPFDDEISDAIDAARAMLLIFSSRCNESEYIRREVTVAGDSGKVIIPFRIEDVLPKRGLRVRLADLHWIDAFVERERAIDELVHSFPPESDPVVARTTETVDPPSPSPVQSEAASITPAGRDQTPGGKGIDRGFKTPEPEVAARVEPLDGEAPHREPHEGSGVTDPRRSRRAMLIGGGAVAALGAAGWAVLSSVSKVPSPEPLPTKPQETVALPEPVKSPPIATTPNTINVGILHSLSGVLAGNETSLKDVMLMLINEKNARGGLLGRKLEAVVVDPASNWPLFAEKARELIAKDKVAAVFGCWTTVSRKSVLPVFKELNNILFYPVQFEGEESERNVFYTGPAPNQQAIPAVDFLMSKDGGEIKRWALAGTDYVYPRTINKILGAYLNQKGVAAADILINFTPFGHSDWRAIVSDIKRFAFAGKKTAVVSTITGDANIPFYKELNSQGLRAIDLPVMALSINEEDLASFDTKPLVGHLAAWNYFQSIKAPLNDRFIADLRAFTKNPKHVTSDPMEAHFIGFAMWGKAVEKAGTTDPDKVIDALPGIEAPNLSGGISTMLPNHHITRPVFVGEVRADGQFDVIWKSAGPVAADAWSKFLPGSKDLIADWVTLKCGNYNTVTKRCGA
jgi:urea transport system substrate-binding protein